MNYLRCVECGTPAVGVRRSRARGAEPLCNEHCHQLEMQDHNKPHTKMNYMGFSSIAAGVWFERYVETLSGKPFENITKDIEKWVPRPAASQ